MKKFYRYMSRAEMSKFSAGIKIAGKRNFSANTDSVGVCFLGESTEINSWDDWDEKYATEYFNPIQCSRFLNGIVSRDGILVEFEIDETRMEESCGVYADPINLDFDATVSIVEYCCPSYSLETVKPLRYAMVDMGKHAGEWYEWH